MVTVRFIHQDNQVGKAGEVVEVGLTKILRQPAHTGCAALAFLTVGIEFGYVEDVDLNCIPQVASVQLEVVIVVAVNDDGWLADKLRNTLEDILLVGRVAKVPLKFLVQRQVRSQHKEMFDAFLEVQISNASTHQSCLTDTGRNRECKRREVALKVLATGADGLGFGQLLIQEDLVVNTLTRSLQIQGIRDFGHHLQRLGQRFPE